MQPARPSSFSLALSLSAASLLFGLVGCASTGELLPVAGLRLTPAAPEIAEVRRDPALVGKANDTRIVPVSDRTENSPWCEYLREDTKAQTTIIRSPTVSGRVDNEGKSSLSVSLSLTNQLKASALEEGAEARCRRHLAEAGLQKLIFVTPQGLTVAGYKAKAKTIKERRNTLAKVRKDVNRSLQAGLLDYETATKLRALASEIEAEANEAQSQADRRLDAGETKTGSAKVLANELLVAEADLEDLNSRMRTLDAIDVSASVGWNDDINQDGFDTTGDSVTGALNFSLKLGAAQPSRFEHEERAKAAKMRALTEGEGAAIWQVNTLHRAHSRAIKGLVAQRANLDTAIAETEALVANLSGAVTDEFVASLLQAELQLLRLKANRAAVNGSISELEGNMKKLSLG